ncbi:MAG: HlyU family transcriptional regulator [Hyphomicrobiaceae bacterium]
MFSFLKKLFGGSSPKDVTPATRGEPVEHDGFAIHAAPEPEGGQWRLAGYIVSGSKDGHMERRFLRADLFSSHDEATEFTIRKGRQIIDEQGDRLFANGERTGRA